VALVIVDSCSDAADLLLAELIRGWWIWAYWISPLSFTVRSLALNEFSTKQWSAPYEYDPSITLGEASLAVFDIQTGYWWVWLGVGVLAAYAIVFNLIATVAFTFLSCKLPQELQLPPLLLLLLLLLLQLPPLLLPLLLLLLLLLLLFA